MSTRPLPPTPYRGPIISARRPLPIPPKPESSAPPSYTPSAPPSTVLKRRAHTRRLRSPPSADLPPVSEVDEREVSDDEVLAPISTPKRRPRPSPLIPSRSYGAANLPLILEIPDFPMAFQEEAAKCQQESVALSPSALFSRRRSETILDFPLPPSSSSLTRCSDSLPTSVTPPSHPSPTPSHDSLASSSSTSSSPYPVTPNPSDDDDSDAQAPSAKADAVEYGEDEFERALNTLSPRQARRSASVLSLRSFSTGEFDAHAEPIYAMLHSRQEAVVREVVEQRQNFLQVPQQNGVPSSRLVLSVLDPTHGGSFDVPLTLGSFLSPPSSPCSPTGDDGESDAEGIPVCWSDAEDDDAALEAALSSSDDDASDGEGPSQFLDPTFRAGPRRRLIIRDGDQSPRLPPLKLLEPLDLDPDTPSVYSTPDTPSENSAASPAVWGRERMPPRESLVPCDITQRSPSPFSPAAPQLRSRFSASTLASLPEPPSSSTLAFFARLTGRTNPPSPSKGDRTPFSPRSELPSFGPHSTLMRLSLRRRTHVPASPVPSAFSFSTHASVSRSSLDSADCASCASEDSAGSTGLRRPPIPIELFLRG